MKMLLFICGIADKIDDSLRKEENMPEKEVLFCLALLTKRSNRPISPGVFKSVSRRNGNGLWWRLTIRKSLPVWAAASANTKKDALILTLTRLIIC